MWAFASLLIQILIWCYDWMAFSLGQWLKVSGTWGMVLFIVLRFPEGLLMCVFFSVEMVLEAFLWTCRLKVSFSSGEYNNISFQIQWIKYFSFLMTKLSSEIVSWGVVPKLPTKAKTVHLPYDKAWIESKGPGTRGQTRGSSWIPVASPCGILCPMIVLLSIPLIISLLAAKVILGWKVPILSVWGAILLLSLSYTIKNILFLCWWEIFLWIGFSVFQKSKDIKMRLYDYHLFWYLWK